MIQGSKEWLEMRRGKIGASDAAVIMGLSPFNTKERLLRQKLRLEPDTFKTPAMQRGIELEPVAREIFNREMGIEMIPDVVISPKYNWHMSSLDGISPCRKKTLEIKLNGKYNHLLAIEKRIPVYYLIQIQHQFFGTDAETAYYMSYYPISDPASRESFFREHGVKKEWVILEVARDEAMIEEILKAELEFWRRMQEFDLYDEPHQRRIISDLSALEEAYIEAAKLEKEAKEKKENVLRILKEKSEGESFQGKLLSLTKYTQEGRVQYQNIPELKNINLDQYRGPEVESWRVTLRKTA